MVPSANLHPNFRRPAAVSLTRAATFNDIRSVTRRVISHLNIPLARRHPLCDGVSAPLRRHRGLWHRWFRRPLQTQCAAQMDAGLVGAGPALHGRDEVGAAFLDPSHYLRVRRFAEAQAEGLLPQAVLVQYGHRGNVLPRAR